MRIVFALMLVLATVAAAPKRKPFGSITFDHFWSVDEIYDWFIELESKYPEIVEIEQMGTTEGGIQIRGIRITNEALLNETTPIVFVTAGMAARDWISVMSAVDIIHELVEHYDEFREIVDNVDWYILPVSNPDGYTFSHIEGVSYF